MIFGEVGLTGEVRGVNYVEQRLAEAVKMGFHRCILPGTNARVLPAALTGQIEIQGVSNVRELAEVLF